MQCIITIFDFEMDLIKFIVLTTSDKSDIPVDKNMVLFDEAIFIIKSKFDISEEPTL